MEIVQVQVMAGVVSTSMFVFSTLPMLFKALKTRNLASYSLGNLALSNLGNLVHWFYVASLPLGPIRLLHGFFTLTTAWMLAWYVRSEMGCALTPVPRCLSESDRWFTPHRFRAP